MSKIITGVLFFTILSSTLADVGIAPTVVGGNDARPGQFPYMVSIQNAAIRGRLNNFFKKFILKKYIEN